MKIEKIKEHLTAQIKEDITFIGVWPPNADQENSVPIYHASSPQAFNQIIGYAKFINSSNGTVLYRGQCNNHPNLLPSGARPGYSPVPDSTIIAMQKEESIRKFFGLENSIIKGWEQYQNVLIEAVLQHYGANTFCMDFVDNHWCALWFGLYKFDDNSYIKRCGVDEKLYIYLYLADTNGASVCGMYIGEDTYTVDLRKALPSTFARPAAQHGWIVRTRNRKECNYNDRVIGVIEINVDDAAKWLGEGELLSQNNFFPNFFHDQGYYVLLSRQLRSGVASKWTKILPIKTICNYHYPECFFVSDHTKKLLPCKKIHTANKEKINNIAGLYSVLLEKGWSKETCAMESLWNEENPVMGQSLVTALLVQMCFGGDILYFVYSNRTHHFNCIQGSYIDLTFDELDSTWKNNSYPPKSAINLGASPYNTYKKHQGKLKKLIKNCGITTINVDSYLKQRSHRTTHPTKK